MLQEIADVITTNIEEIVRKWVDELRRSQRTKIHNQLLTAEIVDGIKGMLANLAEAIALREMPDQENPPAIPLPSLYKTTGSTVAQSKPMGTTPFSSPLARAQHAASSHGLVRHNQHYEIHEVVVEYIKLRQLLWETIRVHLQVKQMKNALEATQYIDRLLDELLLTTLEQYYSASVHDLEKRAIRDPLTQLYNKEYFAQRLGEELRRAMRSGEPLTVAMLDMDKLKEINDTYGHQAGDAVIVAVASAIHDTCRRSDIPCRYGGDEFAVILPETGKAQARVFAERVMRALNNVTVLIKPGDDAPSSEANRVVGVLDSSRLPLVTPVPTLSVGLATFPDDARNPETLLSRADAALYRAKGKGRNRIE